MTRSRGLEYNPAEAVATLCSKDAKLAAIIHEVGPFALERRAASTPFDGLLRSIVYQQLSGKAAHSIHTRVLSLLPRSVKGRAAALVELPEEDLRGAGLSRAKTAAMRELGTKTLDGTVPNGRRLRGMSDEEISKRLTEIRGIGPWTVEMLLMFELGRPDVLPITDLGIRKGFMRCQGTAKLPTPKAVLRHGNRWRPFRSVASWYLWRATELAPLPGTLVMKKKKKKKGKSGPT